MTALMNGLNDNSNRVPPNRVPPNRVPPNRVPPNLVAPNMFTMWRSQMVSATAEWWEGCRGSSEDSVGGGCAGVAGVCAWCDVGAGGVDRGGVG